MKMYFSIVVLLAWFFSVSCEGVFLASGSRYTLDLPNLPYTWETMLGNPHWQIEWFDGEGKKRSAMMPGGGRLEIFLPGTLANPVLALPFWPKKGIAPGVFKPAGAIFPFDVSGGRIVLSWQGGVDATLFMELARSVNSAADGGLPPGGNASLRLPWNFNWPRFRRLFDDPALNGEVRADPWLADWSGIAARTVQSGFDRRRLVPEARNGLEIPLGGGPWIGTSPFAAPMFFDANPVFLVRASPSALADTWVSAGGLLRINTQAWVWREFP